MSKELLVSIILVNYNGKAFIKECIDSVLNSDYPNFEVIVVDNASNDRSYELLKQTYLTVHPGGGMRKWIKIIRSEKQLYFTGGSNLGAKNASGEKLIFLNSDTVVTKNWLQELLHFVGNRKRFLAQPKILIRQLADPKPPNLPNPPKPLIDNAGGRYIFPGLGIGIGRAEIDRGQYDRNYQVDFVNGTCFMIDKELFEALGGFDETYHFFYEDIDLCLRAKRAGGQCFFCGKSVIYHKRGQTIKTALSQEEIDFYIHKNRLRTITKNFTGPNRWIRILLLKSLSTLSRARLLIKATFSFPQRLTTERPADFKGITLARYKFASRFIQGKKVLDLGTGLGNGAYYLSKNGAGEVLGVDNYKPAITQARKSFVTSNLNFGIMDALDILSFGRRFDVITAFEIIEHLPSGSYSTFVSNLKEILTPGGICLVSTPNKKISSPNRPKPNNPFHTKEFTPEEFASLIKKFFPKVELLGIKCTNKKFLEKDKLIKRKLRNRLAVFLSKYKVTHEFLPLIPRQLRLIVTSENSLPNLRASDFKISKQSINDCESLLVVCK